MEKLIVTDSCIGCGLCVQSCEKYFEFNDDGFSQVKVDEEDKKELLNLVESCPGQAILIEEEKEA